MLVCSDFTSSIGSFSILKIRNKGLEAAGFTHLKPLEPGGRMFLYSYPQKRRSAAFYILVLWKQENGSFKIFSFFLHIFSVLFYGTHLRRGKEENV